MLLTIFCMVCTAHRQCSGLVLATDSIIDGRESQILAEHGLSWWQLLWLCQEFAGCMCL